MAHWIENDKTRSRFWAFAKGDLGLDEDEVHEALGVESAKDYAGTKEKALNALKKFAYGKRRKERGQDEARLQGAAGSLPESPLLAWAEFYTPAGFRWTFSLRAGLSTDLAALALEQVIERVEEFEEVAAGRGWTPRPNGRKDAARPQPRKPAAPQEKQPPAPPQDAKTPAPPATEAPPPPSAPAAAKQGGGNGHGQGGEIQAEFVKVVAPKGKPVVEFWRPNRKWAEIRYHLGGESLVKIAPALAEAGWTPAHFDAVGSEYQLPVTVVWQPSADGKYKDITEVRPR